MKLLTKASNSAEVTEREKENLEDKQARCEAQKTAFKKLQVGSNMDMSFADEIPGIGAILFICQLGLVMSAYEM